MSHPALSYGPAARPAASFSAARVTPSRAPAAARAAGAAAGTSQATRYRDAELASATPGQLVVLLFDKMALTLRRARVAMDAGEIAERCELLMKAADMITELQVSLDHAVGGDISRNLDALYAFMVRELHAANRQQDGARIDVVLRIAGELRDAFAGAQQQLAAAPAPAVAAARTA